MCYKYPGPRCTGHATTRLKKAEERLAKDPTNRTLKEAREHAFREWLITPGGIKDLERRVGAGEKGASKLLGWAKNERIKRIAAYKAGSTTTNVSPADVQEFILKTRHGSHLYGLNHADSDEDWYLVVAEGKKRATQRIIGDQDVQVLTLGEFVRQVHKGVPQALEALFTPMGEKAALDSYRKKFFPDTAKTTETYRRTIKSFALGGDLKHRRHGLRLIHNLNEFLYKGQFNPLLDEATRAEITRVADSDPATFLAYLRKTSIVEIAPKESNEETEDVFLEELKKGWYKRSPAK